MSERDLRRTTDLFRELRGKLALLDQWMRNRIVASGEFDYDEDDRDDCLLREADKIIAELEGRANDQVRKRRKAAERYQDKHPGKRARARRCESDRCQEKAIENVTETYANSLNRSAIQELDAEVAAYVLARDNPMPIAEPDVWWQVLQACFKQIEAARDYAPHFLLKRGNKKEIELCWRYHVVLYNGAGNKEGALLYETAERALKPRRRWYDSWSATAALFDAVVERVRGSEQPEHAKSYIAIIYKNLREARWHAEMNRLTADITRFQVGVGPVSVARPAGGPG